MAKIGHGVVLSSGRMQMQRIEDEVKKLRNLYSYSYLYLHTFERLSVILYEVF